MARRKSSHRAHRTKRSRRTKHNRRRHTRRVRRTRRGGDGSIGTPYPAYRVMPLRPEQTLDGRHFSRPNQIGGGLIPSGGGGGIGRHTDGNGGLIGPTNTGGGGIGRHQGGTLQPTGSRILTNTSNGQTPTFLTTGGRG